MKYLLSLLTIAAPFLAKSQSVADSILIEGHYRSFLFTKPVSSVNSLLFIMHGSGGSGENIMKNNSKLEALAASEKLLIVYPNGYQRYWNECRRYATSSANVENINENLFFESMIAYFQKNYGIDTSRVVAAGFSGGGHMAYKLGLTMPGRIKAIAAIVANMPDSASTDCIAAGKPLPVLIVNGTLDNTNPYNGGEMFVNNASYGRVLSTENSFSYWVRLAGYVGPAVKKQLPDKDPSDQKTIESYTYNTEGKPQVTLLRVIGGKHDYPNDIDVYSFAWNFFKSQLHKLEISRLDPNKQVQLVDAACGECQFGLTGKNCDLAVRINGKAYFVDGTDIDSHGDAHAKDGFCNAIRKAEIQGAVKGERFVVTYFKLRQ